ncbi:MAG TPA: tyrosine-type recombinase/integrase [Myxococcales bacterium]|nr:tyrosine-type recombinase/integrase [Myxococcales bacterium]
MKGGKAVALPIPTPLVPYLEGAIESSGSEFVFPGAGGEQLPEHTPMEKIFRRILKRAGFIVGWKHSCRRCAARKDPTVEKHPDATIRPCPRCGARMWPSEIPRPMRFHDCRHTTITLLLQLGVPPQFVQRIARHANIRTTLDTYGHLSVEDLRAPLEALGRATAAPEKRLPTPLPAKAVANLGPSGVQGSRKPQNRGPGPTVETVEDRALELGAEHRVRTGDPSPWQGET